MTTFFLAALVSMFAFLVFVLVNFQGELLHVKRQKLAGARSIRVNLPRHQSKQPSASRPTVVPIRSGSKPAESDQQEFYQLESAYAGSLFVLPLRGHDVEPDAVETQARLISAKRAQRA
jgi:hypothetical protein